MKKILIPLLLVLFGLGTPAAAAVIPEAAPGQQTPAANRPRFIPGELLLKVKPGVSAAALAASVNAVVARPIGDGSIVLLELRSGDVPTALAALKGRAGVVFAEPNWLRQLHVTPSDPGFGLKWDLNNTGTLCDDSGCASTDADIDWLEAYNALRPPLPGSAVLDRLDR